MKEQLLNELNALAKKAESNSETLALAGCLYAVCSASHANNEAALLHYVKPFMENQVAAMKFGQPIKD